MKFFNMMPLFLFLSCGEDSKDIVASFNTPPSLRIEEPLEGIGVAQYDEVLFVVYIEDSQDEAENLKVTWRSDIQADFFGPETSDEDGYILYPTTSLIGGYHTILITVEDSEGLTAAASVQVDVEALAAIQLLSPEEDEYGRIDEETEFSVIIRDGVDSIEELQIDFSSTHPSILGSFCTPTLDSQSNTATCAITLPEGLHNLTFSSTNSREETVSVAREFQVYSPLQIDDDGDGYCESPPCINTENDPLDSGSPDTGMTDPMYLVDCDDSDANVAPNKLDILNGIDDNCNGFTDEGDDDGDGYCEVLPCLTSITEVAPDANDEGMEDCDDSKNYVYPGATELPNQEDDDCDGIPDEETDLYDDDGDGYSESQGDCDDTTGTIFPGSPEGPNGLDDDCDGMTDEGTIVFDDDGDGYCESPPCIGSLTSLQSDSNDNIDCNDSNNMIYEGATETANSIDDDCDGTIDEGTTNFDDDGDGQSEIEGDCDDSVATTYQNAPELVNGVDDNCNTLIDDDTVAYDDDGDGQSENDGDCNDDNISIYLGANEVPNGEDDDCDGTIDEGTVAYDDDGDGYSENDGDCDDDNNLRSPGHTETCTTSFDDNCNSDTNDINAQGCTTYYEDVDNDGYGISSSQCSCNPIDNYRAVQSGDCQDSNADVRPNQTSYFDTPYTDTNGNDSYDYNCANGHEKEDTSSGSCNHDVSLGEWCTLKTAGWKSGTPSCGSSSGYMNGNEDCECNSSWWCSSCNKKSNSNKTQLCK